MFLRCSWSRTSRCADGGGRPDVLKRIDGIVNSLIVSGITEAARGLGASAWEVFYTVFAFIISIHEFVMLAARTMNLRKLVDFQRGT